MNEVSIRVEADALRGFAREVLIRADLPPDHAETVADIAEPLGVDRDALLTAVQDPAIKERLKIETTQALEAGVFGSPFVIIDGEPFWGSDRLWMIRRWLKSGGW